MNDIIVQGIGALAYIVLVASYFRKQKSQILSMQIIALILYTIHYQFLHRYNRRTMQFYKCNNDANNLFV